MSAPIIVNVPLHGRAYDIHIAAGALDQAGELITPILAGGKALLVADETVAERHAGRVLGSLRAAGAAVELATFPAGEVNKSLANADAIWQACGQHGIDRSGTIIALGGGVTGDLSGFVAAGWMRGIRFIQIPTTLLAMVDSSVGGKTGVNSAAGKNLIGAFHQPAFVLIDPTVLTTMAPREYRAGLAEVAKYGVIRDADFFAWQEAHATALVACDPDAVGAAVAESCRIKAWYVLNDEREHGVRAHLNYGHTFGHALERETGYTRYLHGEAVSIGMQMALDCAQRLDLLTADDLPARQTALLTAYQLPLTHAVGDADEAGRLTQACLLDKKARQGKARFIIPQSYGEITMVTDPDADLITASFLSAMTGP